MPVRQFLLLLFLCSSALAQEPVYKNFETDSVAEPRGGMGFLTLFLQTNLHKPITAEAEGLGGRVILNGVVEPDGRITGVSIARGIRPDMDREAIRVFSLFNAWKPAQKSGKPVRQLVTIPVNYPKNEPFHYVGGAKVDYFNEQLAIVSDSSQARFKQLVPIDTSGFPSGDIVLYEQRGKSWKEANRLPIVRQLKVYKTATGKWVHQLGYQNQNLRWENLFIRVDDDGKRVQQATYRNGERMGAEFTYHENGAVAEKIETVGDKETITSWYSNGQIRQIRLITKAPPLTSTFPEQVTAFWNNRGQQTIQDGNGRAVYQSQATSCSDTTRRTLYREEGAYENGYKQGVWTGRYADGSYFYEERYDKGLCQGGKAHTAGADTVQYSKIEEPPMFKGGLDKLSQFISQTLRYPVQASQARVQGRVMVSFVIDTDGSVDEVKVLKGLGFGIDEEAIWVVKATKGRWTPGTQRGRKVRVKHSLPINFTL